MKRRASSVLGAEKNASARTALDDAAAMQQHDLAGEAPASPRSCVDITTLMPRAATARMMSSIALVAAGIEARGRLVEEQHLADRLRERAREREPLLLAAGEPARRPLAEPAEADQREQLADARVALGARHAGCRERVARCWPAALRRSITGRWNTMARRVGGTCSRPPQVTRPRDGRDETHREPQQRGLAGAVRSDQHGRCPGRERQRDACRGS